MICRGVQRDVVKDLPTHVDLMRLRRTSRVKLFIPVNFINHEAAPGIKRGGVLTVVRAEVELSVIAGDIPEGITVDLTGRGIGDVIHISDVTLPEGVKPTIDRDFVIANITAPSGLVSADNEAAAEGEEEAAEYPGRSSDELIKARRFLRAFILSDTTLSRDGQSGYHSSYETLGWSWKSRREI